MPPRQRLLGPLRVGQGVPENTTPERCQSGRRGQAPGGGTGHRPPLALGAQRWGLRPRRGSGPHGHAGVCPAPCSVGPRACAREPTALTAASRATTCRRDFSGSEDTQSPTLATRCWPRSPSPLGAMDSGPASPPWACRGRQSRPGARGSGNRAAWRADCSFFCCQGEQTGSCDSGLVIGTGAQGPDALWAPWAASGSCLPRPPLSEAHGAPAGEDPLPHQDLLRPPSPSCWGIKLRSF